MKTFFLFFTFVSFFLSSQAFAAQKVKNCSSSAESEVESTLRFLQNNLGTIMRDVGDLTDREKEKLRDKIDRVDIKCMDHKPVCQNHDERGGISRHIFQAAVVICYNRIRDVGGASASCLLADTVFHEIAHTANVDHERGHNDGPNNDKVYRTGRAASNLCFEMGRDDSIPRNTNDD